MIIANQAWNKMSEWERLKNYKVHVERVKNLSSPLHKKRSKKSLNSKQLSNPDISYFRNCHKTQELRLVDLENQRLIKKLSQIGRRKSQLLMQSEDERKYLTINMRSRQANRRMKDMQIQHHNDMIVDRIVKVKSKRFLNDSVLQSRSLKKSRTKRRRNVSVILPSIFTQPENVEQQIENKIQQPQQQKIIKPQFQE